MTGRALAGGVTAARGWRAGTADCGIREATNGQDPVLGSTDRDDLTVVYSERPCDAGGVFTQNKVKSASVVIDQLHLKRNRIQGFVVSSGNANACTGGQGFRDALQMAKVTADQLDLDPDQIIVGTTGVIGRYLPMPQVKAGIERAAHHLDTDNGDEAAAAIMTTDTVPKTAGCEVDLPSGGTVRVGGMAKGSGMIHPNMATMLAFVTTDAAVERGWVADCVKRIADQSFNQVTVDGDSSTNDSFLIFANGAAHNPAIAHGTADSAALEAAILEVARDLARQIARDGEGATKLIEVKIEGAQDQEQARLAARSVASSNLVKTAVHGGDPNWGRIVCALGYSGAEIAIDRLRLTIAGLAVFDHGAGQEIDLHQVRVAFEKPEIEIRAELGLGEGRAEAWGCDLSAEYVHINADYTT